VITLDNISKRHGSQILYVDASMAVFRGEKIGLVGPNGAGKSTIFRLIVKQDHADEGTVSVERGLTIGYFDQDVGEMAGRTVLAETMAGAGEVAEFAHELAQLEHAMADPEQSDRLDELVARYGEVQPRFEALGGYDLEARAHEILAGLGFASELADSDVGKLSGGWKMRVALARILLMKPDVMLLDEPTNHLDIESMEVLEGAVESFDGTAILISHDRYLLDRLCDRILEVRDGDVKSFDGGYDDWVAAKAAAV
jgi:ATPase subunit of ABC transporter with duplicated ATPase domains